MLNPWLLLPSDAPYVLPADRSGVATIRERVASSGRTERLIDLNTLPEPFIGNPTSAKVLLLNLNPGASPDDKKAHADPAFRQALLCNLREGAQEYPFYPLDPALSWTACARWWTSHLRLLLEHPDLHRSAIAQRLCVIEWFPYHSRKSGIPDNTSIPSQEYCFTIAKEAIEKKLIIGMRARNRWAKVDPRLALVPYLRNPQSPYISPANAGETLFREIVDALRDR
jgi:hypothetical protein